MKYIVSVISNFNTVEFEANSRDSVKHLRDNGGYRCIIRTKGGKFVSGAEFSETFGFYHICDPS